MKKLNCEKKSCKDVFNAFMLSNADYSGNLEFPIIEGTNLMPEKLVCFSKINSVTDYHCYVHFFEHDYVIERIWKYPYKYLSLLKKFDGVITPDFSLYRDMPLFMQLDNIGRSRMVGRWLQDNGINVIVNVRYGDERTYRLSCVGVPHNSTIALGTYGTMKTPEDREILEKGLSHVLQITKPNNLLIYGSSSEKISALCKKQGVNLQVFKSDFALSHSRKKEVK